MGSLGEGQDGAKSEAQEGEGMLGGAGAGTQHQICH